MKSLFLSALALAGLLFGGCATPAQSSAMMPTLTAPVTKHAGSVSVAVTGGSTTTATTASQISNEDFAAALEKSILQSGLFSRVVPSGSFSGYQLAVQIVRLDQPMFGFSMTATVEANWTLTNLDNNAVVWRKAVVSSYTAKTGEAFAGVTRLRLATEGAARNNIQDALAQIGALTLP